MGEEREEQDGKQIKREVRSRETLRQKGQETRNKNDQEPRIFKEIITQIIPGGQTNRCL